ncbi:MAG: mechanosensitive ion channel family protein [Chitinophagaceae bacterium]|nr:MAG: mechanosensitive ion channel family protein [Chitinophagaceae bacterium]
MNDYLERFKLRAFDWIITTGPKILAAIALLLIGLWLIKVLNKWLKRTLNAKAVDASLTTFFLNLFVTILKIALFVVCMQLIGVEMTIFVTIIGAASVAIGLALSGTMQNFASGILILLLKPFRVGDTILAQGQTGIVQSIQLFYTVVVTFDNRTVIYPNSKLSNEVIVNLSREGKRRLDIEILIPNTIPYDQVKTNILEVLNEDENILRDPEPRIGISTIEAEKYKVMISAWTQAHGFEDEKQKLQEALMSKKAYLAQPAAE